MGPSSDSDTLRIHLLGGFRVWVGPRAISDSAWRLSKAKAIVKLLALTPGHRLHRDQILDILWPDLPADAAANNLHQTLHAARRTLFLASAGLERDGVLSLRGQILTLSPPESLWVDVDAFRRAVDATKKSRKIQLYEQAIGLYSGDLLPEDRYEDWIAEHRDRLSQGFLSLFLDLASLHENAGHLPAATGVLEEILKHDAADEETHVRLMRLYARIGERERALSQFQHLQEVLRRDLDVAPQPSTVRLFEDIRARRFPPVDSGRSRRNHRATAAPTPERALQRHRPSISRKRPEAPPGNLPIPLTSFVGREHELAALQDLLAKGRLLTLTGAGGTGKTRLALELATRAQHRFSDGAWWVDFQSLRDGASIPYVVAAALRIRELPGRPIASRIADRLRSKQSLVVLDNCEHVAAGCAALVESLLMQCNGLRFVVTSRERLSLLGEMRWPVPPMALPPPDTDLSASETMQFEASLLFVNRCGDVRPDFVLSERNTRVVAEICRQLDGLPLLIELAAARTHQLSLEHIRDRLADRLSLLKSPGTSTSRYRTVVEAIDWSYKLLDEDERLLFNRLAVFAGTFALDAAQAICADEALPSGRILDVLSTLVDKSMVGVEETADGALRYRMLTTLRQYGLERLEGSGRAESLNRRCAEWYVHLAETSQPEHGDYGPTRQSLRRIGDELPNIRAVVDWCQRREEAAEPFLRLVCGLWRFLYYLGHKDEAREWVEAALARSDELPAHLRAQAHVAIGAIAKVQGDFAASLRHREEALRFFRAVEDRPRAASMLRVLGWLAQDRGEHDQAGALHRESLAIFRAEGDRAGAAGTLRALAWLAVNQGEYATARAMIDESLATFRAAGDLVGVAISLRPLGMIVQDQGDYVTAGNLHQQRLTLFRDLNNPGGEAISLHDLGRLAQLTGELDQSATRYQEALEIFQRWGNHWGVGRCLHGLGQVACLRGDHTAARSHLEESLSLFKDLGFEEGIGTTLAALGEAACKRGDYHHARQRYREALHHLAAIPFKLIIAECLEGLAAVATSDGEHVRAAALAGAAAALREHLGAPIPPCSRQTVDQTLSTIQARLGPEPYRVAVNRGKMLTLGQAVDLALTPP